PFSAPSVTSARRRATGTPRGSGVPVPTGSGGVTLTPCLPPDVPPVGPLAWTQPSSPTRLRRTDSVGGGGGEAATTDGSSVPTPPLRPLLHVGGHLGGGLSHVLTRLEQLLAN